MTPLSIKLIRDGKVLTLPQVEKEVVRLVLIMTEGNKTAAAEMLNIGRATLYRIMRRAD